MEYLVIGDVAAATLAVLVLLVILSVRVRGLRRILRDEDDRRDADR